MTPDGFANLLSRVTQLESEIVALNARLDELAELKAGKEKRGWLDRSDEEDGGWIGGNDGPDD